MKKLQRRMQDRKVLLAVAAAGLLLIGNAPTATADNFYAGKTIRVAVGFAAGGGYDTYARAVTRHMRKHIPGNPMFVVDTKQQPGSIT